MSSRVPVLLAAALVLAPGPALRGAHAQPDVRGHAEYRALQSRLARGWNTWDSRSVLRHVALPEGFALNLALKQRAWLEEPYLQTALIGRAGEGAERVRPGPRSFDGRYTELEIEWHELHARVQSAVDGDDLLVLITPLGTMRSPVTLVVEAAMLWNRPGLLSREGDALVAQVGHRRIDVHATGDAIDDPYVRTLTPHLVLRIDGALGLSSGRPRTVAGIREILERRRQEVIAEADRFGALAEAALAIQSVVAWNTIYEPKHDRVVSTVGRLWNEEYGGYALFGWDNFFLAYLTSLWSRDLAFANVIEHLHGATDEGFVPNDNRGNGSKSYDRSQPPVGSLMVREIFRRYPEPWFADAAFGVLLEWNRWWPRRRLNDGLLSYGSHEAPNPFHEPSVRTRTTAGYETGMDDSPMYEGVPFDRERGVFELQDVGLTSLYVADGEALADLADALGRATDAAELRERAARFRAAMDRLWDEDRGYYLNRRTDTGAFSTRRSPTLFYPLLAGVPEPSRARRLVEEHLLDPDEFWGKFIIPSISRDDPAFPEQRYWKGAIWPPLNFLTYLGLRRYGFDEARRTLAERSLALFVGEWRRKGYVSENYSAITGAGDEAHLSSDPFHSWGALFGIMAFVEAGLMGPALDPVRH